MNLRSWLSFGLFYLVFTGFAFATVPAYMDQSISAPNPFMSVSNSELFLKNSLNRSGSRASVANQPLMTVLVSFNNLNMATDAASWQSIIYEGEFSVNQYYLQNTQHQLNIVSATEAIVEVTLPRAHPNFGDRYTGSYSLADAIMDEVEKQVSLSQFDLNGDRIFSTRELSVMFVIAGYEKAFGGVRASEPNIWAHQSSSALNTSAGRIGGYAMFGEKHGERQASIGLICHELGHLLLNLPDLYDRDGSSAGVGKWGLMSFGTWNTSGRQMGDRPANMLAWSKIKSGFLQPNSLNDAVTLQANEALKIPTQRSGEYFIVENRLKLGFDVGLPASGLLLTHVDDNVTSINDSENHKLIDVEAADGLLEMDQFYNYGNSGDIFPGSFAKYYFNDQTDPNSKLYGGYLSGIAIGFAKVGSDAYEIEYRQGEAQPVPAFENASNVGIMPLLLLLVFLIHGRIGKKR